jgi:hypothetical protein
MIDLSHLQEDVFAYHNDPVLVCHPNREAEVREAMTAQNITVELVVNRWVPTTDVYAMDRQPALNFGHVPDVDGFSLNLAWGCGYDR